MEPSRVLVTLEEQYAAGPRWAWDESDVSALYVDETRGFLLNGNVSKVSALFVDVTRVFLITSDVSKGSTPSVKVTRALLLAGNLQGLLHLQLRQDLHRQRNHRRSSLIVGVVV